jgi:hypothetical protein
LMARREAAPFQSKSIQGKIESPTSRKGREKCGTRQLRDNDLLRGLRER